MWNIKQNNLKTQLLIGFILTLTFQPFFSSINFFVLFMITMIYKKSLFTCFVYSIFLGTFKDLFSPFSHLGIWATSYAITTYILYKKKHLFFQDKLNSFCTLAFLYSMISYIILILILPFSENFESYTLTKQTLVNSVLFPLYDTLFVLCWTIVHALFKKQQTRLA